MAPIKEIIRNSFNPQAKDEEKEQCKQALDLYANLSDPPSRTQFLKEFDAMGGTKGDLTWLAGFEKKIEGNKQWSTGVNEDYLTRTTHIKKIDPIEYELDGKLHYYHPDFYLPEYNLIVEIKSSYTYECELNKNLSKKEYSIKNGYNFLFVINKNNDNLKNIIFNI